MAGIRGRDWGEVGSGLPFLIVVWQSQCIDIDNVDFISNEKFSKKFLNYSALLSANSRAINSYSIVELVILVCLANLQDRDDNLSSSSSHSRPCVRGIFPCKNKGEISPKTIQERGQDHTPCP